VTLVAYQGGIVLISAGIGVMTARALGVHDRGVYVLAFLPPQLLASLTSSPLGDAVTYMTARDPGNRAQILRAVLSLSLLAGLLVGLLLTVLWLTAADSVLRGVPLDAFLVASAATPCYVVASLGQSYLFSLGRTAASQIAQSLERVATFIAVAVVWATGGKLMEVVAVTAAAFVLSAAATLYLVGIGDLRQALVARAQEGLRLEMAVYAWRDLWGTLAQKLTYRVDQLILNLLAGPTAVGLYSIAARLADVPLMGPRALRQSWFAARSGTDNLRRDAELTLAGARKLMLLMAALIVPFGAAGALLIPLAYGEEFRPAVTPFLILLAATFGLSTSFAFVSALAGAGKPHRISAASVIGLIATAALDFALIPRFGAEGAAIASALAYSAFAAAAILYWRAEAQPLRLRVSELLPGVTDARALADTLSSTLRQLPSRRGS
jgi:O-antigen/teichoic acid export membrane protein